MSYIPLKDLKMSVDGIKAQTDKIKFDSQEYIKVSERPKIEVHGETVANGEMVNIPSGIETVVLNISVDGRVRVKGVLEVVGDIDLGADGMLDIVGDGEVSVGV